MCVPRGSRQPTGALDTCRYGLATGWRHADDVLTTCRRRADLPCVCPEAAAHQPSHEVLELHHAACQTPFNTLVLAAVHPTSLAHQHVRATRGGRVDKLHACHTGRMCGWAARTRHTGRTCRQSAHVVDSRTKKKHRRHPRVASRRFDLVALYFSFFAQAC